MTRNSSSRDAPPARDGKAATASPNREPRRAHVELASGTDDHGTRIASQNDRSTALSLPAPRSSLHLRHRPDSPDDYLGAVLGSYRVLELLGKGGMGYVFRAEHVKLGREVALKLLRGDYASRREAVSRFFQEARTVNRVRHRNIVDVTDFVELDSGTTYIVMELLTGTSLGTWARGVDVRRALAVLVQICDGLHAAHQVGVIHRDLKPDNVIIVPTSDGAELAKVLDFGVAKLVDRDDEDLGYHTAAGSVIGTPAYMSPEQAAGIAIDARSDIYSLGAIMYEVFCGQPMFRARSFGEYVRKHLTEAPVPPRQTPGGASVDPQLEAVIVRCLDKDPERRFAHIRELRDALLGLLGGHGDAAGIASAARPASPRRWTRLAGGALVVALGGIAAFWLASDDASPARATAAPSPATLIAPTPVATPAAPALASPAAPALAPPAPAVPIAAPAAQPGQAEATSKPDASDKRAIKRASKAVRTPRSGAAAASARLRPAPSRPDAGAPAAPDRAEPARDTPIAAPRPGDGTSTVDNPLGGAAIAPTDTLDPFRRK